MVIFWVIFCMVILWVIFSIKVVDLIGTHVSINLVIVCVWTHYGVLSISLTCKSCCHFMITGDPHHSCCKCLDVLRTKDTWFEQCTSLSKLAFRKLMESIKKGEKTAMESMFDSCLAPTSMEVEHPKLHQEEAKRLQDGQTKEKKSLTHQSPRPYGCPRGHPIHHHSGWR